MKNQNLCIYCKSSSAFNKREHVMPQAFGKFEQNFTLINLVCDTCNQKFGDELELILARDTKEGYLDRTKHTSKKTTKFKRKRISVKVGEGEYQGVNIEIVGKIDEKMEINILPQIGIKRNNSNWDYFLIDEKYTLNRDDYVLDQKHSLRAFQLTNEQAAKEFAKCNLKFCYEGELEKISQPEMLFEISGYIDTIILRAIAKIGFNYFSYFNNNTELLLNSCFDNIKNYVLHGDEYSNISVSNEAIIEREKGRKYRRLGHIIVLEQIGKAMVCSISLFNGFTYRVLLTDVIPDNKPLRSGFGHFFDVNKLTIEDIGSRSQIIIPYLWTP